MIRKFALVFLVTGSLAGCAPEIETTVFFQDVADLVEDGGQVAAPATLFVPVASEEKCQETLPAIITAMKTMMPVSGEGSCQRIEFNSFAVIETEMTIYRQGNEVVEGSPLRLEIAEASTSQGEQGYSATLMLTKTVDEIVGALKAQSDDFRYMPSFDAPIFKITLDNDTRRSAGFSPDHVFVDGKPTLSKQRFELDRRQNALLRLSDVTSAALGAAGSFTFVTIWLD